MRQAAAATARDIQMDPFTGFVLALIMVVVNLTIQAIAWPFRKIEEATGAHGAQRDCGGLVRVSV